MKKILTLMMLLSAAIVATAQSVQQTENPESVQKKKTPKMYADGGGSSAAYDYQVELLRRSELKLGDRRTLFSPNRKEVIMASYIQYYESLVRSLKANDNYGILDLAKSNNLFLVPNHVDVIVIDKTTIEIEDETYPAVKVRVIKGKAKGKSGWVPEGWLFE